MAGTWVAKYRMIPAGGMNWSEWRFLGGADEWTAQVLGSTRAEAQRVMERRFRPLIEGATDIIRFGNRVYVRDEFVDGDLAVAELRLVCR